jgi:hypothetical protein
MSRAAPSGRPVDGGRAATRPTEGSRAAPSTRPTAGGRGAARPRGPGRKLALPMANATALTRAMAALVVLNGIKLAIRYGLVATAPIGGLLPVFGTYNAVAAAPFALWAMNGPPLPKTSAGALRRATLTTLAVQCGLGLPDTALYARELTARTSDTVQVLLQVIIQATPYALVGAVELAIIAGLGYTILKLRMPRAPRPGAGAARAQPPAPASPRRS